MPVVTSVDSLEDGVPAVFRVRGREIVLVRWKDAFYALRNICPHQTQSFKSGFVRCHIHAGEDVGEIEVTQDGLLVCPWHAFEFGLEDGHCVSDHRLRVRTYPVEVRDGQVVVEI
jgi:nitrite reductase/ring-hydroxylating ferredoxin subunit